MLAKRKQASAQADAQARRQRARRITTTPTDAAAVRGELAQATERTLGNVRRVAERAHAIVELPLLRSQARVARVLQSIEPIHREVFHALRKREEFSARQSKAAKAKAAKADPRPRGAALLAEHAALKDANPRAGRAVAALSRKYGLKPRTVLKYLSEARGALKVPRA